VLGREEEREKEREREEWGKEEEERRGEEKRKEEKTRRSEISMIKSSVSHKLKDCHNIGWNYLCGWEVQTLEISQDNQESVWRAHKTFWQLLFGYSEKFSSLQLRECFPPMSH
jgi:hypothetical protein